jgi:hypothetical protein
LLRGIILMKRSFLARLQRRAVASLVGALLLLIIVPLLQILVLGPQGYNAALATPQANLAWIQGHTALFLLYRLALLLGFALLVAMPFALFRIIIAQEIVGRAELAAEEGATASEGEEDAEENEDAEAGEAEKSEGEENGLPPNAWRGKGFAVIAAWTGFLGLLLIVIGILITSIYLWSSGSIASARAPLPDNYASVTSIFAVLTYTVGGGLLALTCLFFGIVIARSGRRLWPDSWVAFGYIGMGIGAVASGSAVQVALAPAAAQGSLTTPTILLFALWSLWFSIMVVRLKAE